MKYLIGFYFTFSFISLTGGDWSEWSTCSATCQLSSLVSPFQNRECNGGNCYGYSSQVCNFKVPCPGTLSDWTPWEDCSSTCQMYLDAPIKSRTRTCSGGSLGENCNGQRLIESVSCNENVYCPGTVTPWSLWSICSATCNNLRNHPVQYRNRSCIGKSIWDVRLSCSSDSKYTESTPCNQNVGCPGVYLNWEKWSDCLRTCTPNRNLAPIQRRSRTCVGDTLGVGCDGPSYEVLACNFEIYCPETRVCKVWDYYGSSIGTNDAGNQCLRVCLTVLVILRMHIFS
nr:adhesion G protein-coupled receptor B3-like [Hydra vulgaris]